MQNLDFDIDECAVLGYDPLIPPALLQSEIPAVRQAVRSE